MKRAVLEIFGLAKGGVLLEELFSIHVARTIGEWIAAHAVVLAHRTMPTGVPEPIAYRAEISLLAALTLAQPGNFCRYK